MSLADPSLRYMLTIRKFDSRPNKAMTVMHKSQMRNRVHAVADLIADDHNLVVYYFEDGSDDAANLIDVYKTETGQLLRTIEIDEVDFAFDDNSFLKQKCLSGKIAVSYSGVNAGQNGSIG